MKTAPKYLRELYGPITPEKWTAWLELVQQAKAILSSPGCDWSAARAFFDSCGTVQGGLSSASYSLKTKRPFPWCGVHMHLQTCTRSVSLDVETYDSDLRTLAEFIED
jgi:hypothetical protein